MRRSSAAAEPGSRIMPHEEIDAIRAMLACKAAPGRLGRAAGAARRGRLGLAGRRRHRAARPVDCGGVPGEWSLAPGSDPSRVLMFFHGGGYCSGSIVSHRRMVTEAGRAARHAHARGRLSPCARASVSGRARGRARRLALPARAGHRGRRIAVGGDSAGGNLTLALDQPPARGRRGAARPAPGSPRPGPTSRCRARRSRPRTPIDPLIHKAYLEELADAYAPAPLDRTDPLISPLFADLAASRRR